MSPKCVIFSILHAGPAVKSCRTVSVNFPGLLSCAISLREKRGTLGQLYMRPEFDLRSFFLLSKKRIKKNRGKMPCENKFYY